mmetsp:Transcript_11450/g.22741  ORF Transcript_11450/g.22741 Transcript_11450/m.22741 type:complete len:260 (+) Transcript_11450:804-1583(+)
MPGVRRQLVPHPDLLLLTLPPDPDEPPEQREDGGVPAQPLPRPVLPAQLSQAGDGGRRRLPRPRVCDITQPLDRSRVPEEYPPAPSARAQVQQRLCAPDPPVGDEGRLEVFLSRGGEEEGVEQPLGPHEPPAVDGGRAQQLERAARVRPPAHVEAAEALDDHREFRRGGHRVEPDGRGTCVAFCGEDRAGAGKGRGFRRGEGVPEADGTGEVVFVHGDSAFDGFDGRFFGGVRAGCLLEVGDGGRAGVTVEIHRGFFIR